MSLLKLHVVGYSEKKKKRKKKHEFTIDKYKNSNTRIRDKIKSSFEEYWLK